MGGIRRGYGVYLLWIGRADDGVDVRGGRLDVRGLRRVLIVFGGSILTCDWKQEPSRDEAGS